MTSDEYEAALRKLPDPHSLALRLRDAGVADEVISSYLQIEQECLPSLIDLARRKLRTALGKP
jgi:DNA-directed RNA polymerase specialized sigma24 family protein